MTLTYCSGTGFSIWEAHRQQGWRCWHQSTHKQMTYPVCLVASTIWERHVRVADVRGNDLAAASLKWKEQGEALNVVQPAWHGACEHPPPTSSTKQAHCTHVTVGALVLTWTLQPLQWKISTEAMTPSINTFTFLQFSIWWSGTGVSEWRWMRRRLQNVPRSPSRWCTSRGS